VPLIVVEWEGVEVDYCPTCRGTWLDTGELELITELAGGEPGPLQQALSAAGTGSRSSRRCPRCRRRMQTIVVGDTPPVEVERCSIGHGLWLDAGEVATLVGEFANHQDAAVAGFLGDLFRHPSRGKMEET
jgi:Zn-finger nucleic acid-binding protein